MTEGSKFLLYILLFFTGLWLLLFLFALGPIGWLAIALLVVVTVAYPEWTGDDESRRERTNCAECGAPNEADRAACKHCDTPL